MAKTTQTRWNLQDIDPRSTPGFDGGKAKALAELERLSTRLGQLQEQLYAERQHRVLVILQGMDTSGKDGTIRHVFKHIDPLGVRAVAFKAPTPPELERDYLWRVHPHVPANGELVIFNRSHYEDVLVVRVHGLVPKAVWSRRYEHINAFEKMLVDEGTTVLKFFLHISKQEQKKRLLERLKEPDKRWKFNPQDLVERGYWEDYMQAYQDVLDKTHTPYAPWHVIPADRKWYRNLRVCQRLVEVLEGLGMKYPQPELDISGLEGELEKT
ncbi:MULTISPECIES: polyphosphate kinase 2 family protein [unclassified Meiothermus]|uniref:polyphosphate kinase 2 family protein n=1 Tax=unclassified Meiothermus TaxID=370471 RepID=UPI000D7CA03C|nr:MULTISPECIES: polyphosphate kinase 2 family protein [unclassified Meiothermus]PZA06721.1 polyphosphate kinase 2 family protein [Meiothermus sp. Pnk-1]RYM36647.1 polyphosphate kinase 2 family protein [Meiothermus sp. PNK-Is4]